MELVTLILVAVTLIITALGVMFAIASVVLALLGFFGFRELSTMIVTRAEQAVKETLAKYPTPQQLKDDLFARIKPDPSAPISLLESSIEKVESVVQGEIPPPHPISAPYPGEEESGHASDAGQHTNVELDIPPDPTGNDH